MKPGYPWKKKEDGTYAIYGIPVFQKTVDRRGKEDANFNVKALRGLVEANNFAENKNHHPSVHWGHNVDGLERRKLGEAFNFRLGKLGATPTIFADIRDIEEEDFQMIKKGKYPHISVELTRELPRRIGSIAFLSSNAPYFVLPNIRAGEEIKQFRQKQGMIYSANNTVEIVNKFKFDLKGEAIMHPSMKKYEEQEEEKKEEEENKEFQEEEGPSLESISSRLDALEARMDAIEGGEDEEEVSSAEAVPPIDEEGQMKAGSFKTFMAMKQGMSKLKKEIGNLKAFNREIETDRQSEQALRFFSAEGIQVDEDSFRQKYKDKVRRYGANAGTEYIEEIESMATRIPMDSGTPYFLPESRKQSKSDLTWTAKYKEEGEEEYQKATEAGRFYSENAAYFSSQGISAKDFVDGEVAQIRLKKAGVI